MNSDIAAVECIAQKPEKEDKYEGREGLMVEGQTLSCLCDESQHLKY